MSYDNNVVIVIRGEACEGRAGREMIKRNFVIGCIPLAALHVLGN